jgi:hypothetical protein
MGETWQERSICRQLLSQYGHTPILKANYEHGPRERETVYYDEPTPDLIDGSDFFLMIPRRSYGLTSASGRSIAHEELALAQRGRKDGMAFGLPPEYWAEAQKSQQQLLQQLSPYLGAGFKTYERPDDFATSLQAVLAEGLPHFGVPLRPNKLFLSHSSSDKGFVERLAAQLLKYGFDVWYDKFEIGVGDSLLETIRQGIEESAYVILVLSPDSVNSDWVQTEIELAVDVEKHWGYKVLLPVKCRDFVWPTNLAHLADLKYADFTGQEDIAVRELVATLRGHHH